uniref:Uncharacterized protein n=1 Tax=Romanomermis culicivorax TaxID=13658 RepID=A0A915K1S8_ROMCU
MISVVLRVWDYLELSRRRDHPKVTATADRDIAIILLEIIKSSDLNPNIATGPCTIIKFIPLSQYKNQDPPPCCEYNVLYPGVLNVVILQASSDDLIRIRYGCREHFG